MKIDNEYFDVFFDLSETGPIAPGQTITAGLRFLCPDLALLRLSVGKEFLLWEGKVIAKGRLLEMHTGAIP
jgi:hypothetical protein